MLCVLIRLASFFTIKKKLSPITLGASLKGKGLILSFKISFYFGRLCVTTALARYDIGTVKILKFGTPQTIAIIVIKIEKFDVTLH